MLPWLSLMGLSVAALPAAGSDRDALRRIVQEQCAVAFAKEHNPAPCEHLEPDYAVLADRKGGAHFLLIPTRTLSGIESPDAAQTSAPNYFANAWQARASIAASLNAPVRRDSVGLATNPKRARSQDQMHIHIECLRASVAAALREQAAKITAEWTRLRIDLFAFEARRIMGEELTVNPIALLAAHLPAQDLAEYSLIIAGMNFTEGPGFVLLSSSTVPGELLLDAGCDVNREVH